jgi:hypothetical protein
VILANLGKRYKEICKLVNELPGATGHLRTPAAAHQRMKRLAIAMNLPMKGKADVVRDDREATWAQRIVDMDIRFKRAMLRAGYLPSVVRDDSPLVVRRYNPTGVMFTQSIGGECADHGDKILPATRTLDIEVARYDKKD